MIRLEGEIEDYPLKASKFYLGIITIHKAKFDSKLFYCIR